MNIIVDTSAWIEHLKKPLPELIDLLSERRALVHPVVLGELACGTLRRRHEVLGNLKLLPRALEVSLDESLELIEMRRLYGRGLSFSDVQILGSALLSGAGILTFDRALSEVVGRVL